MGLIKEVVKHPTIADVEITVDTHAKDEVREDWDIIDLDTSFSSIRSPKELIDLGTWLISEGTRIMKKYTPKGKLASKAIK